MNKPLTTPSSYVIECDHYVSRDLVIDGETIRARYFGSLSDREFHKFFVEQRIQLPPGWYITHMPVIELRAGSARVDILRQMPLIMNQEAPDCYASLRRALEKELGA